LVTSLFAIGLVPFIILMLAVGLRGLIGFRVEGRGIRTFRLRMDAVALSNALFLPQSRAGEVRDERQWLMEEIKRLESDDWPGAWCSGEPRLGRNATKIPRMNAAEVASPTNRDLSASRASTSLSCRARSSSWMTLRVARSLCSSSAVAGAFRDSCLESSRSRSLPRLTPS
jgi:hypothetical protein